MLKAEKDYYSNQFDNKCNSIKQIWSNLNRVCSVKKNKANSTTVDKLLVSGIELTDPLEISNAFNNYFCNVGPNLVKNLPKASKCFTDYMGLPMPNSMFVDPVTMNFIR